MYPATPAERDRFVVERRGPRRAHDPWRYQSVIVEDERTEDGAVARVATVFLTGRECPWRCVMCDLWQHTIPTDTPPGAIPSQIRAARLALEHEIGITRVKLYNAGNFFEPRAVPEADYMAVAAGLAGLDRVIVESHPTLIGPRLDRFLEALGSRRGRSERPIQLEVAMGLETANPKALEQLHKRMTVNDFAAAAATLNGRGVALRVFLLISPPFVEPGEQDDWLVQSIDFAFACGATVVSLVPTRPGNGAMEALAAEGSFHAPALDDIERSVGLADLSRGRVFVDLWDLERFSRCSHCFDRRRARLQTINLEQVQLPLHSCPHCGCGLAA